MSRGKRDFGTVRKRANGRWQAYYMGPDLAFHRAPSTFQAKVDAEAWLAAERRLIEGDQWSPAKSRRARVRRATEAFGPNAEEWLAHRELKPRTRSLYRRQLDRFLLPAFGEVSLRDITPAAMPDRLRALVLLGAWCGLRFGELTELRRGDVDLRLGVVRVRRGVVRVDGKVTVGSPKSAAGIRDVAIPPHLMPVLEDHFARHVGLGRDALVFSSVGDSTVQVHSNTVRRHWVKARAAAGRPDLRVHDLRHTGAVLAARTGATLAELMARIGQSTPQAAMRYQHAARGRDAEIAGALSQIALATKHDDSSGRSGRTQRGGDSCLRGDAGGPSCAP